MLKVISQGKKKKPEPRGDSTLQILDMLQENIPTEPQDEDMTDVEIEDEELKKRKLADERKKRGML
jgi:hypothetical protein